MSEADTLKNGAAGAQELNQSVDALHPASEAVPESAADGTRSAADEGLPSKGRQVNQTELALIMGVTDVTLWEWQKLGLPVLQRGERGQANVYNTAAVIAWKVEHEVRKVAGDESPKDRLARVSAELKELELAERRQQMIPAALIEPAWASIALAVRQALLPLGLRLAQILEATPGVDAKRQVIDEEVHDILLKLSTHDDGSDSSPDPQGHGVLRAAEEGPA